MMKDRIGAALAEAGYPNATIDGPDDDPSVTLLPTPGGIPDEVCWKAFQVCGFGGQPCFPCWTDGYDCVADTPGPRCELHAS